ncbi:hypothetical protein Egran_04859 [Elaphomyces granulatus]|uniref:Uncharacterized protein n=1 Tax=Elaphomyces granulatus TaxID=519963 RepID=A0A232LTA4_9EURO|nr:hypothetical protein Egran_04859 [Elaphomyces granulatus]
MIEETLFSGPASISTSMTLRESLWKPKRSSEVRSRSPTHPGICNKDARTDHNGGHLSYSDALSQNPINWPQAIKEELQSHDNSTPSSATPSTASSPPSSMQRTILPAGCRGDRKNIPVPRRLRPSAAKFRDIVVEKLMVHIGFNTIY